VVHTVPSPVPVVASLVEAFQTWVAFGPTFEAFLAFPVLPAEGIRRSSAAASDWAAMASFGWKGEAFAVSSIVAEEIVGLFAVDMAAKNWCSDTTAVSEEELKSRSFGQHLNSKSQDLESVGTDETASAVATNSVDRHWDPVVVVVAVVVVIVVVVPAVSAEEAHVIVAKDMVVPRVAQNWSVVVIVSRYVRETLAVGNHPKIYYSFDPTNCSFAAGVLVVQNSVQIEVIFEIGVHPEEEVLWASKGWSSVAEVSVETSVG
jgi:hypothetical protein